MGSITGPDEPMLNRKKRGDGMSCGTGHDIRGWLSLIAWQLPGDPGAVRQSESTNDWKYHGTLPIFD